MADGTAFLTGAFRQGTRELTDLADRQREKKERERRLRIMQQAATAIQEYQRTGKAIDPKLAAEAASVGFQVPAGALRGFDPSVLRGTTPGMAAPSGMAAPAETGVDHAAMGHTVPGGGMQGAGGIQPMGGPGGAPQAAPSGAAALFEAGAISGPEAIIQQQQQEAAAIQAKNRQFALDQFHEAQGRIGKKPTSQFTTEEFLELSKKWWATDPKAAVAFAKEWRRTWTDSSGKPIAFSQDLINTVDEMIDGGDYLRKHFNSEEWRYIDDVAPTDARKRAWLKNKISTKEVRQSGAERKQADAQRFWPFGGEDRDLEKWARGQGAELSRGKRDYFSTYYFTTGEPNYQAEFEEGWKVVEANQKVVEKRNRPPQIESMLMRVLQIPPDEIEWRDVAADLPLSMTLDEFKEEYIKTYRELHNGAAPNIPQN